MFSLREEKEAFERKQLSPHAFCAGDSEGRLFPCPPCTVRTCFQRDIDRIVRAKAFRRLIHKTQVFFQPEGDHYRNRMTHTMEVSRIARTIAQSLHLNQDLTEAIALGHDLGHTPFGHTGEEALGSIMAGGFSHNEQSLRVVDQLENNGEGLNLSYEVRDGILCHTGKRQPQTLEGQIVRLSDRIAYLNHDIDDAVRGGILQPDDLPPALTAVLGKTFSERIHTLIVDTIHASRDQSQIQQSPAVGACMLDLRQFLFQAVYHNSTVKKEESKAKEMVVRLFFHYKNHPDRLPPDFQNILGREGIDRAVCDYVAGMTDHYAVDTYIRAFIPHAWEVK